MDNVITLNNVEDILTIFKKEKLNEKNFLDILKKKVVPDISKSNMILGMILKSIKKFEMLKNIFTDIILKKIEYFVEKSKKEEVKFRCNLTGQIMKEPVRMQCNGMSYEKDVLVNYLKTKKTCPCGNERFTKEYFKNEDNKPYFEENELKKRLKEFSRDFQGNSNQIIKSAVSYINFFGTNDVVVNVLRSLFEISDGLFFSHKNENFLQHYINFFKFVQKDQKKCNDAKKMLFRILVQNKKYKLLVENFSEKLDVWVNDDEEKGEIYKQIYLNDRSNIKYLKFLIKFYEKNKKFLQITTLLFNSYQYTNNIEIIGLYFSFISQQGFKINLFNFRKIIDKFSTEQEIITFFSKVFTICISFKEKSSEYVCQLSSVLLEKGYGYDKLQEIFRNVSGDLDINIFLLKSIQDLFTANKELEDKLYKIQKRIRNEYENVFVEMKNLSDEFDKQKVEFSVLKQDVVSMKNKLLDKTKECGYLRSKLDEIKIREREASNENNSKVLETKPPKSIFVTDLPTDITKKEIYNIFSKYGEVVSVYHNIKECFSYINYLEKSSAELAQYKMTGKYLGKYKIRVMLSQGKNIPKIQTSLRILEPTPNFGMFSNNKRGVRDYDDDEVYLGKPKKSEIVEVEKEKPKEIELSKVITIENLNFISKKKLLKRIEELMNQRNIIEKITFENVTENSSTGIVTLRNEDNIQNFFKKIDGKKIGGRKCFIYPHPKKGVIVSKALFSVIVTNFPGAWTRNNIKKMFKSCGIILEILFSPNNSACVIDFQSLNAVELCFKTKNGSPVGKKKNRSILKCQKYSVTLFQKYFKYLK